MFHDVKVMVSSIFCSAFTTEAWLVFFVGNDVSWHALQSVLRVLFWFLVNQVSLLYHVYDHFISLMQLNKQPLQ